MHYTPALLSFIATTTMALPSPNSSKSGSEVASQAPICSSFAVGYCESVNRGDAPGFENCLGGVFNGVRIPPDRTISSFLLSLVFNCLPNATRLYTLNAA